MSKESWCTLQVMILSILGFQKMSESILSTHTSRLHPMQKGHHAEENINTCTQGYQNSLKVYKLLSLKLCGSLIYPHNKMPQSAAHSTTAQSSLHMQIPTSERQLHLANDSSPKHLYPQMRGNYAYPECYPIDLWSTIPNSGFTYLFLHLHTSDNKSTCVYTVAPISILNIRASYTQTQIHGSINPFVGNPFLLFNSSPKIQQLVFRSLIPFTKTLSNKSEEHFLLHMSVMNSSRVIPLIPSWLYNEFLQSRLMIEMPRACKKRRKTPHKEKQKLDSLLVLSHYYCLISFCINFFYCSQVEMF